MRRISFWDSSTKRTRIAFWRNLRERFAKFGLELHPDKTRRIEFGRFAEENRKRGGEGKPETFDFLGVQHISGKNRLGASPCGAGRSVSACGPSFEASSRSSASACIIRFRKRGLARIGRAGLLQLLRGTGNLDSSAILRERLRALWWQTLRRRSQQRHYSWTRMMALGERWLPSPRVLHPYPAVRFAASHPR